MRRTIRMPALGLLVLSLPLFLGGCFMTEYTGQLFSSRRTVQLCAKVTDDGSAVSGQSIVFKLSTIWGGTRTTQAATTNAIGAVCMRTTVPADVYKVEALSSVPADAIMPAVLTVFSDTWLGVFAGGKIEIPICKPTSNASIVPTRDATFGIIYRIDQEGVLQAARLLFLDPERSAGPVQIASQDLELQLVLGGPGMGIDEITEVHLRGPSRFTVGGNTALSSNVEVVLTPGVSWDVPSLSIKVFQSGIVVYEASGVIMNGGLFMNGIF